MGVAAGNVRISVTLKSEDVDYLKSVAYTKGISVDRAASMVLTAYLKDRRGKGL